MHVTFALLIFLPIGMINFGPFMWAVLHLLLVGVTQFPYLKLIGLRPPTWQLNCLCTLPPSFNRFLYNLLPTTLDLKTLIFYHQNDIFLPKILYASIWFFSCWKYSLVSDTNHLFSSLGKVYLTSNCLWAFKHIHRNPGCCSGDHVTKLHC